MRYPIRVLFLCTGNSARSQMAEGMLRFFGGDDFEVFSAGTHPKGLNPLAVAAMREVGIDISSHRSKDLTEFLDQEFDYIITVCDQARDACPDFPGDEVQIHWGYPDPAAVEGDDEARMKAFRKTVIEMRERIRNWILTQRKLLREQGELKAES